MATVTARSHIYPNRGVLTVEARVTYPSAEPPEHLVIHGTRFRRERTYRRLWDDKFKTYVCPACNGHDVTRQSYCDRCGARLDGFNGGPRDEANA